MHEELKTEFKEDYEILASKFFKQKADLAFIMLNNEEAKTAVDKGIELVKQVKTDDEATRKASNHTQRDLLNLLVRIRSRLENTDGQTIRGQESAKHGMCSTFLKGHDEAR